MSFEVAVEGSRSTQFRELSIERLGAMPAGGKEWSVIADIPHLPCLSCRPRPRQRAGGPPGRTDPRTDLERTSSTQQLPTSELPSS